MHGTIVKKMTQTFCVQKLSSKNVAKYGTARQATDDNIIRCMGFACWRIKVTDTHSEFAFHIIGFANGPQCYVHTHFTYLVIYEA